MKKFAISFEEYQSKYLLTSLNGNKYLFKPLEITKKSLPKQFGMANWFASNHLIRNKWL